MSRLEKSYLRLQVRLQSVADSYADDRRQLVLAVRDKLEAQFLASSGFIAADSHDRQARRALRDVMNEGWQLVARFGPLMPARRSHYGNGPALKRNKKAKKRPYTGMQAALPQPLARHGKRCSRRAAAPQRRPHRDAGDDDAGGRDAIGRPGFRAAASCLAVG